MRGRGISPVVGVLLLFAIVVALAGVSVVMLTDLGTEARDTNERPIPVSHNLLSNGGFEQGENGVWENGNDNGLENDAEIVTEESRYGAYALKMTNDAEFTGQNVTEEIDDGNTYQMCAWSKVTDTDANAWVGVQYYDADGDIITDLKKTYKVTWTSYEKQCVLTEIGPDADAVGAEVWVYRGNNVGTVYADGVELVRMRYFADPEAHPDDAG